MAVSSRKDERYYHFASLYVILNMRITARLSRVVKRDGPVRDDLNGLCITLI